MSGADQSDSHDRTAISFSENNPLKSAATTSQTDVCLTATHAVMAATKKQMPFVHSINLINKFHHPNTVW
jgi:hypothetical protein